MHCCQTLTIQNLWTMLFETSAWAILFPFAHTIFVAFHCCDHMFLCKFTLWCKVTSQVCLKVSQHQNADKNKRLYVTFCVLWYQIIRCLQHHLMEMRSSLTIWKLPGRVLNEWNWLDFEAFLKDRHCSYQLDHFICKIIPKKSVFRKCHQMPLHSCCFFYILMMIDVFLQIVVINKFLIPVLLVTKLWVCYSISTWCR